MRAYDPAAGRGRGGAASRARGGRPIPTRRAPARSCSRCSPSGTSSAGSTSVGSPRRWRRRARWSTPATCSIPRRCAARLRLPGRRPLMPRAVVTGGAGFLGRTSATCSARAAGRSSRSTTSSPGDRENVAHLADDAGFTFVEHDVIDEHPGRRAGRRGAALREPGEPARVPRAPDRDARGRVRSARAARSTSPARTAPGSCSRRPARSTATRWCTRSRRATSATSTASGRARCTTRRSASPRRSRWRTTASSASTPRSCASSTPTARGSARPTAGSCRTSSPRRCAGEPLTVYGDGKQTRSFCFVSDEVAGCSRCSSRTTSGPMNIGNPDEFTMLELAELVLEVTGADSRRSCSSRCPPTTRSSAGPTSRSRERGARLASGASTSAKVSPARTTGTGGTVASPEETDGLPQALGDRARVRRAQHRRRDRAAHARGRAAGRLEIVIVDDGSTDGTRDVLRQLADSTVRVITHDANRGKGAAIRSGLEHVTGDLVLVQDADLEYDPEDWPKLLARCSGARRRSSTARASPASDATCCSCTGSATASSRSSPTCSTTRRSPTWRPVTSSSTARVLDGITLRGDALRVRARGHGQDPAAGHPHLRGADLVHRPRVRRGEEDHLARRLRRARGPSSSTASSD